MLLIIGKSKLTKLLRRKLEDHQLKEKQLKNDITQYEKEIESLKQKESQLQEDIAKKEAAEKELKIVTEEIGQLKKQIIPLKKNEKRLNKHWKSLALPMNAFQKRSMN